jgi:VIT1/CCC1 family predicted Fe2+/Mn2+ transporter
VSDDDRLTPAAIMGLGDGAMSIIGVIAYATGHSGLVLWLALSGGLSAAASMAGNEWLSRSGRGPRAALVMGAATLTGSVLPALPYAFLRGWHALAASMLMLGVVAFVVARLRAHRAHPYLETAAVLGVVLAVSIAAAVLMPGGTG